MGDYNGRIEQIVRAFQKYPAGDLNTRIVVREALADERADGFKQGYSEGMHDANEAHRSEREHTNEADDWRDDWEMITRDDSGNIVLKHKETAGRYRIIPEEDL